MVYGLPTLAVTLLPDGSYVCARAGGLTGHALAGNFEHLKLNLNF